jgi:hypothetical protein
MIAPAFAPLNFIGAALDSAFPGTPGRHDVVLNAD